MSGRFSRMHDEYLDPDRAGVTGEDEDGADGVPGAPAGRAKVVEVPLDDITPDPAYMVRAEIDPDTVADYAEALVEGAAMPPVLVYDRGGVLVLADGWHRYHAARKAGLTTIRAEVRRAGPRTPDPVLWHHEALAEAIRANVRHGRRYSARDKRRVVEIAVGTWPEVSARTLAALCGVSHDLVARVRRGTTPVSSDDTPGEARGDTAGDVLARAEREALAGEDRGKDRETGDKAPGTDPRETWDLYLGNLRAIREAVEGLEGLRLRGGKEAETARYQLNDLCGRILAVVAALAVGDAP